MKLFEVLPELFFSPLSGPNKHIYAEAALLLFEESRKARFGIPLEALRDSFQELFESWIEQGLSGALDEFDEEANEGAPETPKSSVTNPSGTPENLLGMTEDARQKANALIRRLAEIGWIDIETRESFRDYVVLPAYTNRFLALLNELADPKAIEYQRFAFATYGVLTGEEARRRPALAVREAREITLSFERELLTLYQNMKHHMETVVKQSSLGDVLAHHFEVYQSEIIDKSYHRLKTSDHVSRYRLQILNTVREWRLDAERMEQTIRNGLEEKFYASREEAERDLVSALDTIESVYNDMDEILYQIDLRHHQYVRASYDRARYLSRQHGGLDQALAQILDALARAPEGGVFGASSEDEPALAPEGASARAPEDVPGSAPEGASAVSLPSLFPFRRAEAAVPDSLMTPRKRARAHQMAPPVVSPVPDALRQAVQAEYRKRLEAAITRAEVEAAVRERLGSRQAMELAEWAPERPEEALLLLYLYVYGQDGGSSFLLERIEPREMVASGPYTFANHRLVLRRGGREGDARS
ncbi:Wadjet anti-phage system protein JetA family protein [Hydrogenibacillus schlegelii]|uniref:Chromosome partition protein smc n=1 Tax=Hydrogenibacillus schlegelii TaxID=1484 RepID=A0A132NAP9_HYDSH|nr:Wadjet anti-phage system protein JetA family protein [Hydrogenibacillus schlegelii]KWX07229.1 hypothetical protein TR75_03620 [Hydrogenibacillus schlegelii]OAR03997.1 hypothetical protein SA87_02970 [Hydrogenibacillus schlegelii]